MLPLDRGGFLVDTPGFSEVGVWDIDPASLDQCFADFKPFLGECRYGDCRHVSEPGCRIREAVEQGAIGRDRWESYCALLTELESAPREWE
jgi:ribosome biogenesis GTPase